MLEIWTEKYRPKTLREVVGHENIIKRLIAFVENKNLPHCLFAGPAGTGKTTSALAMARDLYGDNWRNNFLELNASDDRGINVVRSQIKDFARTKPLNAPFKIIFLDESDALTPDAQQALRRTMERYSSICRFIFSANYSSKIIEPIQSRCAVFRFTRLKEDAVREYLKRIKKGENLEIEENAVKALIRISEGDLRNMLNILQAASVLSKKITENLIFEVSSSLRSEEVKEILEKALDGKFDDSRKILHNLMIERGLDGLDVIRNIHREIYSLNIDDRKKMEILKLLGEYEFRITEGASPDIQIESFLAQLSDMGD